MVWNSLSKLIQNAATAAVNAFLEWQEGRKAKKQLDEARIAYAQSVHDPEHEPVWVPAGHTRLR